MKQNFFSIIKEKPFGSIFWIQLLGAFHDNLFRATLLIMVTWGIGVETFGEENSLILTTIIGGVAILPFLLFSSIAGQLADKYDKSYLIRVFKGIEIGIMLITLIGLFTHSLSILLFTLFLTMVQSSFFGPIKYSFIPTIFKDEKLVNANALVESSTFLAIIAAMQISLLFAHFWGYSQYLLGFILLGFAVLSFVLAHKLPLSKPADPTVKLNWNFYKEALHIVRYAAQDRQVFMAIIGISWFWVIGAIMMTYILAYAKNIIGGNMLVGNYFMTLFALGIGVGSYVSNKIMRSNIDAYLVPWGAAATTFFLIDFVVISHHVNFSEPVGVLHFLSTGIGWHISMALFFIAASTGLSLVPLYTIMQTLSKSTHCSRIVAANNIMNSFFMVMSSLATIILIKLNVTLLNIFLIVALLNLFVMHRLSALVPESILQLILQAILKLFFRVEIKGMHNFHKAGDKVLIIANHVSFLDPILIFAFIPERLSYAIYTYYINKWWVRIISPGADLHPVDPVNPMATKKLIELIRKGRKCVIFPEGRITDTGALMKVFDGPGMIADRSGANILPIRIEGAQYSHFSRLKGKVRRQLFPKITVNILPPQHFEVDAELKGRERRRVITNQLYDVMIGMIFDTSCYEETIIHALFEAANKHGMGRIIVEDIQRQPMSYRTVIMRSFILGNWIKERTKLGEYVGVLLPTSAASLLSFVALLLIGRVPAMLNFSLGPNTLLQTCKLAQLNMILTSRRFVELARLEATIELLESHVKIVYLEDLRTDITIKDKLVGLVSAWFPERASHKIQSKVHPKDPAVILFTSGSEGTPKGVVLSHINLNANRYQITTMVDLTSQDVLLNVLPTFHSFGLTGGLLTPLLTGIKSFMYPSPLHYRVIPVIAYDINATIFFATDTFLTHYGIAAHPYDFYSMRYVVSGAEKLRPETRRLWMDKFGIQIYDGYGTTEASPALAINTRMQNKVETVGRFVPGIQYRIVPVDGIEEGGRLVISGPNVMLGYINPETGKIIPPSTASSTSLPKHNQLSKEVVSEKFGAGWYDTGDIVSVDIQGFVTIKGRAKRFAKIAGEMVSLAAVEEQLQISFPGYGHVVLALPDSRKGEQLIILTTADLKREDIIAQFKKAGLADLMIPRRIFVVDAIPVLPTGKTDFVTAKTMLNKLMEEAA